jgi:hypothetical protein
VTDADQFPTWHTVAIQREQRLDGHPAPAHTQAKIASVLALAGIAYALVLRMFTSIWVPGWTLLFIAVLFLGGVQLVCLGIIGECLGRIYWEVKRRPLYLIKERLGFPAPPPEKAP